MSEVFGKQVVLVTFAGRRDRMELLAGYVAEAMRRNLIDEWHVWDFCRNDDDRQWLSARFPVPGRTPDDLQYYPAGYLGMGPGDRWRSRVRAGHDVHIAIEPRESSADATAFELVVGGWKNGRTVLRCVDNADLLVRDNVDRGTVRPPAVSVSTPGILSNTTFRDMEISMDGSGLRLSIDGAEVIEHDTHIPAGIGNVYVKTGYGSDGEWRFPNSDAQHGYLYHCSEQPGDGWNSVYHFYAADAVRYTDAVFLKMDDDIVYVQLDSLEDFIRFRIREQQYFLVSANIVNNNVCAFFQQEHGAIPRNLMELELPPGGFGGRLWQSGQLAEMLHYHFLENPELYERLPAEPIEWVRRLSINCIAWLGKDLSYMSRMRDDENMMSVEIPNYLKRSNCIFPRFLVSHLSYYTQEPTLDTSAVVSRYRKLAEERGLLNHPV
ncbi:hypothetical protein ACFWPH_06600 [Nocardia sp. NPDC058499]|uniref:hypothetical protein n=1 Tax=Nocardia sp. NPDC058499 TaxID=3346530 RepID=UPI00365886F5